jgi:uncharacterized membrane protein YbhN (UPF0104 family)
MDKPAIADSSRWLRPHVILYALMVLILISALAWQLRLLPWHEALISMRAARLPGLVLGFCAEFAIIPLWAMQWCLLAPVTQPVRVVIMAEIVTISSAIQNTVPFVGGPLSAGVLLRMRAGFANSAVLSLLAIDQLTTGIGKILAIAGALIAAPLPSMVHSTAMLLIIAVLGLYLILIAMTHATEKIQRLSLSSSRPWNTILSSVAHWAASLEALRNPGRAIAIVALEIGKKALDAAAILAIQYGCGIPPSPASAVTIIATLGLSTIVEITPANLGVYEATVFFVYRSFDTPAANALAAAVLQHFSVLLPSLGAGYLLILYRFLTIGARTASNSNSDRPLIAPSIIRPLDFVRSAFRRSI